MGRSFWSVIGRGNSFCTRKIENGLVCMQLVVGYPTIYLDIDWAYCVIDYIHASRRIQDFGGEWVKN